MHPPKTGLECLCLLCCICLCVSSCVPSELRITQTMKMFLTLDHYFTQSIIDYRDLSYTLYNNSNELCSQFCGTFHCSIECVVFSWLIFQPFQTTIAIMIDYIGWSDEKRWSVCHLWQWMICLFVMKILFYMRCHWNYEYTHRNHSVCVWWATIKMFFLFDYRSDLSTENAGSSKWAKISSNQDNFKLDWSEEDGDFSPSHSGLSSLPSAGNSASKTSANTSTNNKPTSSNSIQTTPTTASNNSTVIASDTGDTNTVGKSSNKSTENAKKDRKDRSSKESGGKSVHSSQLISTISDPSSSFSMPLVKKDKDKDKNDFDCK